MRTFFSKTGTTLAILAISLQVLMCVWGGRICFRISSLAASNPCETKCCSENEDEEDRGTLFAFPVAGIPVSPSGSDCCVEPVQEFLSHYTGQEKLQTATDNTTVDATIATTFQLSTLASVAWSPARRLGLPPPALPIVRSTVLLL